MLLWWVAASGLVQLLAGQSEAELKRYTFSERHMGSEFKLVFYAADEQTANRAARAAYDRIRQLDRIMSDYNPESELMRLCRTAGTGTKVEVSPDLAAVLAQSLAWSKRTEGAFDVTCGPLTSLWRRSKRKQELPSDDDIADAKSRFGDQFLELDVERRTVELKRERMKLDLGGIGAGYAADAALAVLKEHGILRAIIDASGDVIAGDPPPGEKGWRVGVAPPSADGPPRYYISLANGAITTSGDAFQFVELDGRRYSHIVDTQTGLGLTTPTSVTVFAQDGTTADALATCVTLLGPEKGLRLTEEIAGAAAIITQQVDGEVQTFTSKRWETLEFLPAPK